MYKDLLECSFTDLGRGPDGWDCWGLVIEVNRRIGIAIPDYGMGIHHKDVELYGNLYQIHHEEFKEVPISGLASGDVVLFKRVGGRLHFGVMVDSVNFITVYEGSQVARNYVGDPVVKQIVKGFYRWQIN